MYKSFASVVKFISKHLILSDAIVSGIVFFLFSFFNFYLFLYLFIFGCAGSSLLHGLLLSCSVWVSHCGGFSYCGAQALGCVGFSRCGTWA